MLRAGLLGAALAGCYPPTDPPAPPSVTLHDQLTLFFGMGETGDVPRVDRVHNLFLYPWERLEPGHYNQNGRGTTAVDGVVGKAQHIAGADGYHFAARSRELMDHASSGFTWTGWASIDASDYADRQTLVAKWTGLPDTEVPGDRREYRVWFEPGLETWNLEVSSDGLEGDGHSIVVTHPAAIERDRMYFLEAWHDAEAQTVSLRVSDRDARGVAESVAWEAGVYTNEGDLDVGAQNACADDHLQGTIDALGYWTRVHTDDESNALWNNGHGREL